MGNKIVAFFAFFLPDLQDFFGLLLAYMAVAFWEPYCGPVRLYLWRRWEPYLPTSSPTNRLASLLNYLWRHFTATILRSLTSPGLVWVLVFSLCSPTTKPLFILRIKIYMMLNLACFLVPILNDLINEIELRLRRRLTGRRGSHDTPIVELQRPKREPPQFDDGTRVLNFV